MAGYLTDLLIAKHDWPTVTYLSMEFEIKSLASYTVPVHAPLVVETRTIRATEGCRWQQVESASLSLGILRSDVQKHVVRSQAEFGNR